MTEQANSPRAREFERLAAKTRDKATKLPEGDSVRAWLEDNARQYDSRAREAQRKANRRAALKEGR